MGSKLDDFEKLGFLHQEPLHTLASEFGSLEEVGDRNPMGVF